MPTLKLYYFPLPGRAEVIRLILTYGKIPFEDYRFAHQEWPELKPKMPYGQVPVLEVDGKMLAQSAAIEYYAASIAGLEPKDPWEAAVVHQWALLVSEIMEAYVGTMRLEDGEEKLKKRQELTENVVKPKLKILSDQLESQDYLTGSKITVADFRLFVLLSYLRSGILDGVPATLADEYPSLKRFRNRVASLEPIKQFYTVNTDGTRAYYKADE